MAVFGSLNRSKMGFVSRFQQCDQLTLGFHGWDWDHDLAEARHRDIHLKSPRLLHRLQGGLTFGAVQPSGEEPGEKLRETADADERRIDQTAIQFLGNDGRLEGGAACGEKEVAGSDLVLIHRPPGDPVLFKLCQVNAGAGQRQDSEDIPPTSDL